LGRLYEASGEPKKAIALYRQEMHPEASDRQGNLLRARWLESLPAAAASSTPSGDGHVP
jgi:hypothetical protein